MSSPVATASASYASILLQAQKAYDESAALLNVANGDKTVEGSIAHQVDQLDTQVKTMNETPRTAETYAVLKEQFVQFMGAQLAKYETAQKAHTTGVKAIETVKAAQADCESFKIDSKQDAALKLHMTRLGMWPSFYNNKEVAAKIKISEYPFAAQLADLTTGVAKVAAQVTVLEASLDKAFFAKKSVEGNAGIFDLIPSYYNSYLAAAIVEKNKLAEVAKVPEAAPAEVKAEDKIVNA